MTSQPDPNPAREAYRKQRQEAAKTRRLSRTTYAQLRAGIRDGDIEADERLDEAALVTSMSANRNAVRRALQMLAADGLVDRRTRAGTSVSSAIVEFSATEILPATSASELEVVDLDQVELAVPQIVADRMGVTSPIVHAYQQLGRLGGVPMYVRSGYAPQLDVDEDFFEGIADADANFRPMATAFRLLFRVDLGRVETSIEWAPADAFTAGLLEIELGAALLLREMVMFDVDGRAREMSFTYFRGDRVSLSYGVS
jgi:GntR family transcriptional regulator